VTEIGEAKGRVMTRAELSVAVALALSLASCSPPHPHAHLRPPPRQISTLDCPDEEGDLQLKSGGAGQTTCVYGTDAGAQVTLVLTPLDPAGAQATMAPVEAKLRAEVPIAQGSDASANAASNWTGASLGGDHEHDHDRVDLDLPGIHIHSHGDGGADIDTAGVHIQAQDHGEGGHNAQVMVNGGGHGGVTVNARDGGAEIRINEPGSGIRMGLVLASEKPGPNGYRMAAYEARGPQGGPLVVARILSPNQDSDDLRHDVKELLKLNVGG
jgi:hypothetical protein